MIRIISCHTNDPSFIWYQKKLLDKFIIGDFEFIIFDDSNNRRNQIAKGIDTYDSSVPLKIKEVCENLGILRIEVPNSVHDNPGSVHKIRKHIIDDPCGWCSNSVQFLVNWCIQNLGDSDLILNIDSDMFPIVPMDLQEFIGDYPIAGVRQERDEINYLWNGIFMFKPEKIDAENFHWDMIEKTDVGGMMHYYLEKNPKYKKIWHLWSGTWNFKDFLEGVKDREHINIFNAERNFELPDSSRIFLDNDPRNSRSQSGEIKFYSEIYTPGFIHYRAGGNWDGYAHHFQRKKHLFNFFDVLLNQ